MQQTQDDCVFHFWTGTCAPHICSAPAPSWALVPCYPSKADGLTETLHGPTAQPILTVQVPYRNRLAANSDAC